MAAWWISGSTWICERHLNRLAWGCSLDVFLQMGDTGGCEWVWDTFSTLKGRVTSFLLSTGVRGDGTTYADPAKVGIISIRLYPATEAHRVGSVVFLRRPLISRGCMVRTLSCYARLADARRIPHPTRTVIGCVKAFDWLEVSEEPFLEFNFQYFKRGQLLFYTLICRFMSYDQIFRLKNSRVSEDGGTKRKYKLILPARKATFQSKKSKRPVYHYNCIPWRLFHSFNYHSYSL